MCIRCWSAYFSGAKPPQAGIAPNVAAVHSGRRGFVRTTLGLGAIAATSRALAQVDVGEASQMRKLVPAQVLEDSAAQQYRQVLAQARAKGALAPDNYPPLQRLRAMANKLIPFAAPWNPRATQWRWEVNLIASKQINAWCMPGGKIAFYTGILDQLKLSDDEAAMIMGHEMAHALREHARERLAKNQATNLGLRLGAQLLGLGNVGDAAASLGAQFFSLKFSRDDEAEADLVGLEIAARGAYRPEASVSLWQKMTSASGGANSGGQLTDFLSTHPSGPQRIRQLQANVPKVQGLYDKARRS